MATDKPSDSSGQGRRAVNEPLVNRCRWTNAPLAHARAATFHAAPRAERALAEYEISFRNIRFMNGAGADFDVRSRILINHF